MKQLYYHANHTNCYTYFCITGDFHPDTITQLLSLKPDKSWNTGEIRKNGTSKYNFSYWQFGTCREYDIIIENQMLKTITPLFSKIDILKQIKHDFDVKFTLEIVPTVRFDELAPCLAPSLQVMQFCCDTQTEIDIDLYISCPDDFENDAVLDAGNS